MRAPRCLAAGCSLQPRVGAGRSCLELQGSFPPLETHLPATLSTPSTLSPPRSQEKALLDQIKELAKKREQLEIRLAQAEHRMDLAMGERWSCAVHAAVLL